jgi:hypothetical protein
MYRYMSAYTDVLTGSARMLAWMLLLAVLLLSPVQLCPSSKTADMLDVAIEVLGRCASPSRAFRVWANTGKGTAWEVPTAMATCSMVEHAAQLTTINKAVALEPILKIF